MGHDVIQIDNDGTSVILKIALNQGGIIEVAMGGKAAQQLSESLNAHARVVETPAEAKPHVVEEGAPAKGFESFMNSVQSSIDSAVKDLPPKE